MDNKHAKAAFEICQRAHDNALPPEYEDEDEKEAREFWEELELERQIELMGR